MSFDFSHETMGEIGAFFKRTGKSIIPLTMRENLDEQIAYKLALETIHLGFASVAATHREGGF